MTYNFVEIKTHFPSSTTALAKKNKKKKLYQDVQIPGQRELQQQYVGQLVLSSLPVPAPSQESSAKKTIAQVWLGLLVLAIRDKLCPNLWQQGDYLIHDYLVVGCQERLWTAASPLVKNSLCLQPPPENQGEGEERKRMRLRESNIGRKNSLRSFCVSPEKGPLLLSRSVLLLSHPSCHIFWDHFQGSNKRLWFMQYRSGPI